jgi:hypothetical protein
MHIYNSRRFCHGKSAVSVDVVVTGSDARPILIKALALVSNKPL